MPSDAVDEIAASASATLKAAGPLVGAPEEDEDIPSVIPVAPASIEEVAKLSKSVSDMTEATNSIKKDLGEKIEKIKAEKENKSEPAFDTAASMQNKFKSDLDSFNAQAQGVFEAQRIADKKAVEKKNELESTIKEMSKYYVPKTMEPPQIFSRPSVKAASKDAIAGEIVSAMDHFDKEDTKK